MRIAGFLLGILFFNGLWCACYFQKCMSHDCLLIAWNTGYIFVKLLHWLSYGCMPHQISMGMVGNKTSQKWIATWSRFIKTSTILNKCKIQNDAHFYKPSHGCCPVPTPTFFIAWCIPWTGCESIGYGNQTMWGWGKLIKWSIHFGFSSKILLHLLRSKTCQIRPSFRNWWF